MTIKVDFYSVHASEIEAGIYVVEAKDMDGVWYQHQGPKHVAFFTEAQATALVWKVRAAGEINEAYWISGGTGYGTADHEMALIEAERFAA
jgi:hypothetical protein